MLKLPEVTAADAYVPVPRPNKPNGEGINLLRKKLQMIALIQACGGSLYRKDYEVRAMTGLLAAHLNSSMEAVAQLLHSMKKAGIIDLVKPTRNRIDEIHLRPEWKRPESEAENTHEFATGVKLRQHIAELPVGVAGMMELLELAFLKQVREVENERKKRLRAEIARDAAVRSRGQLQREITLLQSKLDAMQQDFVF